MAALTQRLEIAWIAILWILVVDMGYGQNHPATGLRVRLVIDGTASFASVSIVRKRVQHVREWLA